MPELSISLEKICFIVVKVKEIMAKDVVTEPDPGSNPTDDHMIEVLEDHGDDASVAEVRAFINSMSEDEQVDLVALTWLGRGDAAITEWDELRRQAEQSHNRHTARYLLGMPLLSNYLEDALSEFDLSCTDFENEHFR